MTTDLHYFKSPKGDAGAALEVSYSGPGVTTRLIPSASFRTRDPHVIREIRGVAKKEQCHIACDKQPGCAKFLLNIESETCLLLKDDPLSGPLPCYKADGWITAEKVRATSPGAAVMNALIQAKCSDVKATAEFNRKATRNPSWAELISGEWVSVDVRETVAGGLNMGSIVAMRYTNNRDCDRPDVASGLVVPTKCMGNWQSLTLTDSIFMEGDGAVKLPVFSVKQSYQRVAAYPRVVMWGLGLTYDPSAGQLLDSEGKLVGNVAFLTKQTVFSLLESQEEAPV